MRKALKGDAVKSALAERGMTQKQLAESIGVSSQAITNWLKGKDFPRPGALLKLATTLRLTYEEIVEAGNGNRPIVAFRRKGSAKTTAAHVAKAQELGMLLKPLVAYLPEVQALRTQITSPSLDYDRLQLLASQTRTRLGIGSQAVLDYDHLIGEFGNAGAVLVPVLWGAKKRHENALHIRLPQEDVTFIFLNLDTRIEDFKFWMAHELAHVYTPSWTGEDKGEDFADALAGALLFPEACAEAAYRQSFGRTRRDVIAKLSEHASAHAISINTVFQQVAQYANAKGLALLDVEEKEVHAVRNVRPGPLVSETLFQPSPPAPNLYVAACEQVFQSSFFAALRRMLRERQTGSSYLQQVLDTSLHDGKALYEELAH